MLYELIDKLGVGNAKLILAKVSYRFLHKDRSSYLYTPWFLVYDQQSTHLPKRFDAILFSVAIL